MREMDVSKATENLFGIISVKRVWVNTMIRIDKVFDWLLLTRD
jgi:hypothetical protein